MSYTWHATCMPCGGEIAHGLAIYMDVQFSSSSVRGGQQQGKGKEGEKTRKEKIGKARRKEKKKRRRKEKGKRERKEMRRETGTNVAQGAKLNRKGPKIAL